MGGNRGGRSLGPLQDRPRPGVEDLAAMTAQVVQHRLAVTSIDPQGLLLSTLRASQGIGVEPFDELTGVGVFIEKVDPGEIHG
jgi:hypothetical protein